MKLFEKKIEKNVTHRNIFEQWKTFTPFDQLIQQLIGHIMYSTENQGDWNHQINLKAKIYLICMK